MQLERLRSIDAPRQLRRPGKPGGRMSCLKRGLRLLKRRGLPEKDSSTISPSPLYMAYSGGPRNKVWSINNA